MAEKGFKGFVYYCPELRLYRYALEGEGVEKVDYKFDADDLEDSIVDLLNTTGPDVEQKKAQANFMMNMTGLARINPHKIVRFDGESDKVEVVDPGPHWKEHDAKRLAEEGIETAVEK